MAVCVACRIVGVCGGGGRAHSRIAARLKAPLRDRGQARSVHKYNDRLSRDRAAPRPAPVPGREAVEVCRVRVTVARVPVGPRRSRARALESRPPPGAAGCRRAAVRSRDSPVRLRTGMQYRYSGYSIARASARSTSRRGGRSGIRGPAIHASRPSARHRQRHRFQTRVSIGLHFFRRVPCGKDELRHYSLFDRPHGRAR